MSVEGFDVSDDVVLLVLVLGMCFSFLIMGIEGAVGGDVSTAVEVSPGLAAIGLTFLFRAGSAKRASGDESTDDYSVPEP